MARPPFGNAQSRQKRVYDEQKKKNKQKRGSTNGTTDTKTGKSVKEVSSSIVYCRCIFSTSKA